MLGFNGFPRKRQNDVQTSFETWILKEKFVNSNTSLLGKITQISCQFPITFLVTGIMAQQFGTSLLKD